MNLEQKQLAEWFIKTHHDFPWWKRLIWRAFGVRRVGYIDGYLVTMYYFKGIYFVAHIGEL
jgi:hypothetical protein